MHLRFNELVGCPDARSYQGYVSGGVPVTASIEVCGWMCELVTIGASSRLTNGNVFNVPTQDNA